MFTLKFQALVTRLQTLLRNSFLKRHSSGTVAITLETMTQSHFTESPNHQITKVICIKEISAFGIVPLI